MHLRIQNNCLHLNGLIPEADPAIQVAFFMGNHSAALPGAGRLCSADCTPGHYDCLLSLFLNFLCRRFSGGRRNSVFLFVGIVKRRIIPESASVTGFCDG